MTDIETFAEWMRRQGHRVIRTKSSFWYDAGPRVLQAFPYHWVIEPTRQEINHLMLDNDILALRYSTPIGSPVGQESYHVIYNNGPYTLASLPKKARHAVSSGLKHASYEPISLQRLADEGWYVRKDTLQRQDRTRAETQAFWETLCLSAEGLPTIEAWGALRDGRLLAAILACTIDDTVSILYQESLSEHMKFGINNALAYTVTREFIDRPGIRAVFYGVQSLDAPISVDEFKFRMNYIPIPVRQRVVFHPLLAPFVRKPVHKLLKGMTKVLKGSKSIAKMEGMTKFYLNGKSHLSEQPSSHALLENLVELDNFIEIVG